LLNLASRYSEDLGVSYLDILQQLEDLRLAEWSEVTPPAPPPNSSSSSGSSNEPSSAYVNYNPAPKGSKSRFNNGESIYVPGTYTVNFKTNYLITSFLIPGNDIVNFTFPDPLKIIYACSFSCQTL
jgi:hypothetical protein